ncbi:MAG: iron-containing alcohol dehydrogenase, partial [Eggerthellaceae bacterium]
QRALIVYGKGSVVRSGLLDRVKASLDAAGVAHAELAGIRPNPEVESVREGIRIVREEGIDLILPIGGGSVIDCAKAVAFGALHDGDVWEFFCGKAQVTQALPIFCVLTIPAAGSEASSSCVISNDEIHAKRGTNGDAFRPMVAFMNPEITFSLPAYQTAAGVTDMIAHICERWFSGVGAVRVTDNIAAGLIRTLMAAAPCVLDNPEDYDARADIMWAGMLAHNDIAGCGRALAPTGRAGGWESHGLEHELSRSIRPSRMVQDLPSYACVDALRLARIRSRFLQFALDVFDIEPIDDTDEAVEDAVTAAIDELQAFSSTWACPRPWANWVRA